MKNKLLITILLSIGMLVAMNQGNVFAQVNKKTTTNKTNTKTNNKTNTKTNTKTNAKTNTKTNKKTEVKTEVKTEKPETNQSTDLRKQAEDLLRFFEETLNQIGSSETPVFEKQIMINESYLKIFVDDKVQVEDDLDENRLIYTYKGIQAYLQDVDFFFKDATFTFDIQTIDTLKNTDGAMVLKLKTKRHLKGVGLKNDSVNSIIDRYIEMNYNENDQVMKIVSMYTTKLNEAEEVTKWWNALSENWKKILKEKSALTDPIDYDKLKNVLRITDLDISNNKDIADLLALEKLTKLKRLDCKNTKVNSLYPIRSLNKLEVVDCSNTGITSIEPLQYASNMTDLFIDNTKVTDIKSVENFTKLKKLSFENTKVNNIEGLIECSQIEDLRMSNTKVDSLSVLRELGELKILRMDSLSISNLDDIKTHKNLEQLSISSTKVTDLSALSTFSNLKVIYIDNTKISSLSPLKNLKKLEKIYCNKTGIDMAKATEFMSSVPGCLVMYNSDILKKWWEEMSPDWKSLFDNELKTTNPSNEQLHKLSLMKELILSGKPAINTLEPASKFTHLNFIDISGTAITDLSPLKNLVDLKKINCSNTKISKIDDLSGLNRLEQIDLSKTAVNTIAPLASCDNLEIINAENTGISKLIDLSKLKMLKKILADHTALDSTAVYEFNEINPSCLVIYRTDKLKIWWNTVEEDWKKIFNRYVPVTDKITPEQLHQITIIKEIDVQDMSEIRSLKPLEMLVYLEVLKFKDTHINDLIALKDLKNVRELVCPGNPISNLGPIIGMKKLEILDCSNSMVSKLEPLSDLKMLSVLKLSGTKVRSLKPLSGLNSLVHLDISGTKTLFIKPLVNLDKLKSLKCYNTKIPGFLIKKFKSQNPDCEVLK
jgi:hypothetical protein